MGSEIQTLWDLIPETQTMVRRTDPGTSRRAAPDAARRAPSQKVRLLAVYRAAGSDGLTDEEAGDRSGLAQSRRCCYWKRCSELRQEGLISAAGERISSAGAAQMVCLITEDGIRLLEDLRG